MSSNKQNALILAVNFVANLNYLFSAVVGSPQCNLGLKLFSIEDGKAICAPIASFQCVESCEWIDANGENGGGCERSSHYTAFRGRRTFLSGIVLSEQNILLQCCASLANSVQLDNAKEAMCHWSEQIETVIGRPNIRFNKVLGQAEYYRNLDAIRNGRSAVKVRVEVCRYNSERAFCERNKMSDDDFHKYSLLLLRLQRTKEFMEMRSEAFGRKDALSSTHHHLSLSSSSSIVSAGDEAKVIEGNQSELINNSNRRENGRAIFKNRTNPIGGALLREAKTKRINNKNDQILLHGEVADDTLKVQKFGAKFVERIGRRFWGEKEEIIANNPSPSPIVLPMFDNSTSIPTTSAKAFSIISPTKMPNNSPTTKTFSTKRPFFINPSSNERILYNDPQKKKQKQNIDSRRENAEGKSEQNFVEKAKNFKTNESKESIRPTHNHEAAMGPQHLAIRRIRYPQIMEQKRTAALMRPSTAADLSSGGQQRRLWPILATNSTKVLFELIPTNIDQNLEEQWRRGTHQIRSGNVGKNWHNLRQTNHSFLDAKHFGQQKQNPITIRALSPSSQNIPPAIHRELRIKKLSRNSNSNAIRTNLAVKHLAAEESREKQLLSSIGGSASGAGGSFASAEPLEEVGHFSPVLSSKVLPQISTRPLEKAPQFKFLSPFERPTEAAAFHHQSQFGTAIGTDESIGPKLGERLMECCQQQALGCRAICRRDVNKEQVKKVMVSGQCPPVTMTGVIQCFPRFFNISSVGKCCQQQNDANISMLSQTKKAQNLPLQCLSLCEPNFHLTFAHLACVEHIEHILNCYRQLLDENNSTINENELRQQRQQQKMIIFPSSPFS